MLKKAHLIDFTFRDSRMADIFINIVNSRECTYANEEAECGKGKLVGVALEGSFIERVKSKIFCEELAARMGAR